MTKSTSAAFTFSGSDPVSGGVSSGVNQLQFSIDGGTFAAAFSPVNLSGLTEGNHTVQVRAVDNAGNIGPASSYPWGIDLTPPTVSFAATPPSTLTGTTAVFSFAGNDPSSAGVASGVNHFEAKIDGGSFAAVTNPLTLTGLVNGSHTLQYRDVDNVGNVGSALSFPFAVDIAPPLVVQVGQGIAPASDFTDAASASVTASFSEPVTGVASSDFAIAATGTVTASPPVLQAPVSGSSTYSLAVSNITGDGTLAVNVVNAGSIQDLVGNPLDLTSGLQSFQSDPVLGTPSASVVGDFNDDGIPDLLVTSSTFTNLLLGNGDGTFKPAQLAAGVASSPYAVAADLSNDGKLDLVENFGIQLLAYLGNGDGTFKAGITINNGTVVPAFAVADVNHDGIPDIVAQNVGVLLGNGDGTFKAATPFPQVPGTAISLQLVDVNGDGKPDLVVGTSNGYAGVELGNGDGTFRSLTSLFVGSNLGIFAAVGDFNGDGNLDVVAVNSNGTTGDIFLGNGDGTFKSPLTFAQGSVANSVSVADMNGDGKPDLVLGEVTSNHVAVLLAVGDGTFQPPQTYALDGVPGTLAVADVNADSKLDVIAPVQGTKTVDVFFGGDRSEFYGQPIIVDHTPPTVSFTTMPAAYTASTSATFVLLGVDPVAGGVSTGVDHYEVSFDGAPFTQQTTTTPQTFSVAPGSHSYAAYAVDKAGNVGPTQVFNWFVDTTDPSLVSFVRNASADALTNAGSVTFTATFSEPVTGVVPADFAIDTTGPITTGGIQVSGSGSVYRIAVPNIVGNGTVGVSLLNNPTIVDRAGNTMSPAAFTPSQTLAVTNGPSLIGDFNNDGHPDLLFTGGVAGIPSGTLSVMFGNGDGTFRAPIAALSSSIGWVPKVAADLNGDGNLDLIGTTTNSPFSLAIAFGNGNGTFKPVQTLSATVSVAQVVVADINGDGNPDIADIGAGTGNNLHIAVRFGNGDGAFKPQITMARTFIGTPELEAADVNGDGKTDLLVGTPSTGGIETYFNNGNGTFTPLNSNTVFQSFGFLSANFNGDGFADIVQIDLFNSSNLDIYLGNGDGNFRSAATLSGDTVPSAVQTADVNGDGNTDIIAEGGEPSLLEFFMGNGNGTFKAPQTLSVGASGEGLLFPDLNGDGKPDLFIHTDGQSFTTILLNTTPGPFPSPVDDIDQAGPVVTLASTPPAQSDNATARFDFYAVDPTFAGVSSGVAGIEVSLDGGPFVPSTGPSIFAGLTSGGHIFQAKAVDELGNVGPVSTYAWNVNLAATTETIDVDSVSLQPSADLAVDNDFTRFVNAFANVQPGDVVVIHGTLDWGETNALASWAATDYAYALPHVDDVTVNAASPGDGITGPGDILVDGNGADVSGEGPFHFDGLGTDRGWNITGLTISNFDTAFFYGPEVDVQGYAGTHLIDNVINVPNDNADLGENGGILLGPGANQTVQGNDINLAGDGGAASASFGILSFTSGGNDWNNLLIDNNTITVTTPCANEKILGIGENSGSVGSNIVVTNNTFNGTGGNDPANQQIAFGITSESVAATASNPAATVTYAGNAVNGANEGFVWGDPEASPDYDFTGSQYLGIAFSSTTLTNVNVGFVARDGGKATIGTTTIANSGMYDFGAAFHADGIGSVLTITDPTTNYTGVDALADQTNGGLVIFLSVSGSMQDVSKAEGNTGFTLFSFPVMLDVAPAANQTFTVQYSTSNGSADGNDYNSASGTLTFQPGQLSAAIGVRVLGDFAPEPNETFFVNLADPLLITNGVAAPGHLSRAQATGTIVNDDVTTLSAGISGASATKPATGLTLMTFPAVLNSAPPAGDYFTVNYATSNAGSGLGYASGNDYQGVSGTLTFLAGSTTPANPLTVIVYGNTQINPNEIFDVTLSTPLLHFTGSSQTLPANLGTATATGTIVSPQPSGASVSVNSASLAPSASGSTFMMFTITLAGTITSNIKVYYATASAGSGADDATGNQYQSASGVVTFTPTGSNTATVSVLIYQESSSLPVDKDFRPPTHQSAKPTVHLWSRGRHRHHRNLRSARCAVAPPRKPGSGNAKTPETSGAFRLRSSAILLRGPSRIPTGFRNRHAGLRVTSFGRFLWCRIRCSFRRIRPGDASGPLADASRGCPPEHRGSRHLRPAESTPRANLTAFAKAVCSDNVLVVRLGAE